MLSEVKAWVKKKAGGAAGPVPNWEYRTHPFRNERGKGWGTRMVGGAVKGWASPPHQESGFHIASPHSFVV